MLKTDKLKKKISKFPKAPGVYIFSGEKKEILYIGKATNLKSRVSSYFRGVIPSEVEESRRGSSRRFAPQDDTSGYVRPIERMMHQVKNVEFQETESVLEALILESNLIKKHQPKYNVDLKDDKSFSYFVVTKEEFPRVLIVRKTDLDKPIRNYESNTNLRNKKIQNTSYDIQYSRIFGPYTSKKQMEVALKIIRKIFPFHAMRSKTEKGCLDFQLGRCPGPYAGEISKKDYAKNIRGIRMILEGKKKRLVTTLEKEMGEAAKKNEFEKAAEIRNKVFALQHIRDISLLTQEFGEKRFEMREGKGLSQSSDLKSQIRIEAYDISNISGKNAVGSMVVFSAKGGSASGGENWQPNKSEYRRFIIKSVEGPNDIAMMREVLARRIGSHLTRLDYKAPSPSKGEGNKEKTSKDWAKPDLVLLDGGRGHLNMAKELFETLGFDVPIVSVAKGPSRKNLDIRVAFIHNTKYPVKLLNGAGEIQDTKKTTSKDINLEIANVIKDKMLIKRIMDEAHRFAIALHRKRRGKEVFL